MKRLDGLIREDAVMDVERPWLGLLADRGMAEVRERLIGAGVSPAKASGIAGWLDDQAKRRRLVSNDTALAYRSTLRAVGSPTAGHAIPGYLNPRRFALVA